MNTEELIKAKDFVIRLVPELRALIDSKRKPGFKFERKEDQSPVTEIDLAVEEYLREQVFKRYPDHGLTGEELPALNKDSEYQWIFDPIDGTVEFIRGNPFWGVILALRYRDQTILSMIDMPEMDKTYFAAKGLGTFVNAKPFQMNLEQTTAKAISLQSPKVYLRAGDERWIFERLLNYFQDHIIINSCYGHIAVLLNAADVSVRMNNYLWDIAATQPLIEEAGGKFVYLKNTKQAKNGKLYSAVFGKPILVDEVLELIREK